MSAALARKEKAWHYSEGIESEILDHVRNKRSAIVFDLCNEGVPFDASIFGELFHWISSNQLPTGQVVWIDQNRSIQAQAESQSGPLAKLVQFEHYDFFVKMMAHLFAPASLEQILSVETELFAERMYDYARKDKLLLCLNATPRLWRVLTVGALIHSEIFDASLVSFPGMSGLAKDHESQEIVRQFIAERPSLAHLGTSVEMALRMPEIRIDGFTERGNSLYSKIDVSVYERSFFSLVTETDFTDGSISRVTEKFIKPFCLGHPAIVIGNPHSLRHMTDLGFETWDSLIDQTYDSESDPLKRFDLLFQEIQRQVKSIRNGSRAWLDLAREIGCANINYSMSGRFLQRYRETYDKPLVARIANIVGA